MTGFSIIRRALGLICALPVILLALGTAPVAAFQVGDTVSNVLSIEGKDVPLPKGTHQVIEVGLAGMTQPEIGAQVNLADYGPVRRVVLARVQDGVVLDMIEVVANTLPNADGWGIASDCERKDIYATLTRHKSGWDVSCLWVKPAVVDDGLAPQTAQRIVEFAKTSGAVVPGVWVEAGFRIANRQDVVDVRYRFAGMVDGAPATFDEAALWDPAGIVKQNRQLDFVQDVAEWASTVYADVEIGFRVPLPEDSRFAAPFEEVQATPSDREIRLAKLKELRDSGVLGAEEYARQEAIIKAETEPELESEWTYAKVAGYKAVTYRIAVTLINAGIDYAFIGTPFAAGVLVILQVIVNSTKFFFHEVMWQELLGVGPLQRDAPRTLDFTVEVAAKSG